MSTDKIISDFIEDPELRKIAKAHDLDTWEWEGSYSRLAAALMMEGAAIAIQSFYEEGRDIEVHVHQSGTITIWGGAYYHYYIHPHDEIEIDHDFDWEDDPIVKQYKCKNVLTLSWDERAEIFGEGK